MPFSGKVPLAFPIPQTAGLQGRITLIVVSGSRAKDNVQEGIEHGF